MYFSVHDMIDAWEQFESSNPLELQGVEPTIGLMSLDEIVSHMARESEIDWRHVVLVPQTISGFTIL